MTKLPDILHMPSPAHGPAMKAPPSLLVIHQAVWRDGVAEYLLSKDAIVERKVSCHFAWSKHAKGFVQMVPMDTIAYHAGASVYNNVPNCNSYSIGIELPGPFSEHIPDEVILATEQLVCKIMKACPSITDCCGHKHIAPGRRQDPNNSFPFHTFCQKLGLRFKPL